jgi:hypothetical protein
MQAFGASRKPRRRYDPVRADLLGVVHLDRDAGLDAGSDDHGRDPEIAHAKVHDGRRERRHHGGDCDRVNLAGGEVAAVVKVPDEDPVLVARLLPVRPDAPVVEELLPLVDPEDRVRVSDVDDKEQTASPSELEYFPAGDLRACRPFPPNRSIRTRHAERLSRLLPAAQDRFPRQHIAGPTRASALEPPDREDAVAIGGIEGTGGTSTRQACPSDP